MYGFLESLKEKLLSQFNYELLREGLIISVEYDIFVDKLNMIMKKNDINGYCKLHEGRDRIVLKIEENNIYKRKLFFKDLESLMKIAGYYVSNYKINNELQKDDVDFLTFVKNDNLTIYFNKKFDKSGCGVNEFLYHVTEIINVEKIRKIGLINKSKNFIENHPERIYLFENIEDCYYYIDIKDLKNFSILKIDCKVLKNIKLYEDPKYQPYIKAYYTYDNIPPYSIEEIKK